MDECQILGLSLSLIFLKVFGVCQSCLTVAFSLSHHPVFWISCSAFSVEIPDLCGKEDVEGKNIILAWIYMYTLSFHHTHKYCLSVSNGRGRKALEMLMLTGCFVRDPLRGFDSRVFEKDPLWAWWSEGEDPSRGGLSCENSICDCGRDVLTIDYSYSTWKLKAATSALAIILLSAKWTTVMSDFPECGLLTRFTLQPKWNIEYYEYPFEDMKKAGMMERQLTLFAQL